MASATGTPITIRTRKVISSAAVMPLRSPQSPAARATLYPWRQLFQRRGDGAESHINANPNSTTA